MALIPGKFVTAFPLLTLGISGLVYIKKRETMRTCSGWTGHPSWSTTQVGGHGGGIIPTRRAGEVYAYSPTTPICCLMTSTLLLHTGHCVRRVWVSSKGSNKVVNILCTEAVFKLRRAIFIWAKLESLTRDGWSFAIFYRKISKNHHPSTGKHSSRMRTVHCHGYRVGGCVCPGSACQGMSAQGCLCQGVCLPEGGVYVAVRGCLPGGVSPGSICSGAVYPSMHWTGIHMNGPKIPF